MTLAIEELMLVLVSAGKTGLFGLELLLLPLGSKGSKNKSVTTAQETDLHGHVNKKFGQASFISNCFIFIISFQLYIKDGSYHRNQPQIQG